MHTLPTELLGQACRVFLSLAYPGGRDTIPARRQAYLDIGADRPIAEYLPPSPIAQGVAREIHDGAGQVHGMEFRLGSAHFPHLKLRVEKMENRHSERWVFMVDTHDRVPKVDLGADEDLWRQLQQANRDLKQRIEAALEECGLVTPNKLLRLDLQDPQTT